MTVDTSGLAAAQARVSQIQAMFGQPAMATAPAVGGFGDAMNRAQAQQTPQQPRQRVAGARATAAAQLRAGEGPASVASRAATTTHARRSALDLPVRRAAAERPDQADAPRRTGETSRTSGAGALKDADAVLATAKKYLGIPYKWGGTNPATGLDCSGFVQLVLKQHGISMPRVSRDQARMGTRVDSLADARPGDLVAFGSPVHHIGIYVGGGKMIHAPHTGDVVKISKVHKDLTHIRRVLPEDTAASAARVDVAPQQAARAAATARVRNAQDAPAPAATRPAAAAPERPAAPAGPTVAGAAVPATTWQQAVADAVTESLAGTKVDNPNAVVQSALAGLGTTTTAAQLAAAQARGAATAAQAAATGATSRTPAAAGRLAPDARGTAALDQAPAHLRELFVAAERKYGVPATLLAAVAKQESNFKPRAVSHAGAQGLMQLMPGTARGLGVKNAFDPAQAVDGAARLLRSHLRTFHSTELALAAYNAGPGAVRKYDGIPPYAETQNYVRRIMAGLKGAAA